MADLELSKAVFAKSALDHISPSACTVKWKHATINLSAGHVKSCCHHSFRKIESADPSTDRHSVDKLHFHDTLQDRVERQMMLEGKRPENCKYCWWIEDQGHLSDRSVWSSKSWMSPFTQGIARERTNHAQSPSWIELNFSNVCTLKCSYCSPIFSSSWHREISEHGPYPTEKPYNEMDYLEGVPRLDSNEREALAEKFWPWFEQVYQGVRLLKITGGEPLLSPHTMKLFDRIVSEPNPKLSLSVNSNLMCPDKIWDDFVAKVSTIRAQKKVETFYLHPSVDSFGERAEYIRFGLDFKKFQIHAEDYLEKTGGNLVFICTLNNLSLAGLEDFWKYVLALKSRFGMRGQEVSVTTELLQFPAWQNLNILPPEFVHYIDETIRFAEANMGEGKSQFAEFEIRGLYRARDLLLSPAAELGGARADFNRFFTEYDLRRDTNLLEVFPEMAEFWKICANERHQRDEHDAFEAAMPVLMDNVKLRVNLAGEKGELSLFYAIAETAAAKKWLVLLEQDLAATKPIWLEGVFYGRSFKDSTCSALSVAINSTIESLQKFDGFLFEGMAQQWHRSESLAPISKLAKALKSLMQRPGFDSPPEFTRELDRLTFLIYRMEYALFSERNQSLIVASPCEASQMMVEEQDRRSFTKHNLFGGLYLDCLAASMESTGVVSKTDFSNFCSQDRISSAFQLVLGESTFFTQQKELSNSLRARRPDIDAGNAFIGRALIGRLHEDIDRSELKSRLSGMSRVKSVEILRG